MNQNTIIFNGRDNLPKELRTSDFVDVTLHIQDGKLVYWEENTKHKP